MCRCAFKHLFIYSLQNQFEQQGGKCGVCGDPYQGPGEHAQGGKYATGKIARVYRLHYDWWIDVEVDFFNARHGIYGI